MRAWQADSKRFLQGWRAMILKMDMASCISFSKSASMSPLTPFAHIPQACLAKSRTHHPSYPAIASHRPSLSLPTHPHCQSLHTPTAASYVPPPLCPTCCHHHVPCTATITPHVPPPLCPTRPYHCVRHPPTAVCPLHPHGRHHPQHIHHARQHAHHHPCRHTPLSGTP